MIRFALKSQTLKGISVYNENSCSSRISLTSFVRLFTLVYLRANFNIQEEQLDQRNCLFASYNFSLSYERYL